MNACKGFQATGSRPSLAAAHVQAILFFPANAVNAILGPAAASFRISFHSVQRFGQHWHQALGNIILGQGAFLDGYTAIARIELGIGHSSTHHMLPAVVSACLASLQDLHQAKLL